MAFAKHRERASARIAVGHSCSILISAPLTMGPISHLWQTLRIMEPESIIMGTLLIALRFVMGLVMSIIEKPMMV